MLKSPRTWAQAFCQRFTQCLGGYAPNRCRWLPEKERLHFLLQIIIEVFLEELRLSFKTGNLKCIHKSRKYYDKARVATPLSTWRSCSTCSRSQTPCGSTFNTTALRPCTGSRPRPPFFTEPQSFTTAMKFLTNKIFSLRSCLVERQASSHIPTSSPRPPPCPAPLPHPKVSRKKLWPLRKKK